jgi:hypothetical protein
MLTDSPTGLPRWPVRAVGYAHFTPPTHRTRRDGLGASAVRAAGRRASGSDYAFAPPVASSRRTDRFRILAGFIAFAQPSVRHYDTKTLKQPKRYYFQR